MIDIVVIEKIVEYINFNKKSSAVVVNPYKHNEDIEVKIRVFSLLSTILEKTKKTFITFLDVNVPNLCETIITYQHRKSR